VSSENIKPAKLPQHLQTKHKKGRVNKHAEYVCRRKLNILITKILIRKIVDKDKKSIYNGRGTVLRKELHLEILEIQRKGTRDLFVRHDF
jgi:hypothetical protein